MRLNLSSFPRGYFLDTQNQKNPLILSKNILHLNPNSMHLRTEDLTRIEIEYDSGVIPPPYSHIFKLKIGFGKNFLETQLVTNLDGMAIAAGFFDFRSEAEIFGFF